METVYLRARLEESSADITFVSFALSGIRNLHLYVLQRDLDFAVSGRGVS